MTCPYCEATATTARAERPARGYQRVRCRACGRVLNGRTGPPVNRLQEPTDVVCLVVLGRVRYQLRRRDLAELSLPRGRICTHEAGREWEGKRAPILGDPLRQRRHGAAGPRWYGDATYGKVQGQWSSLDRAIDRDGNFVAARLSDMRALAAAEAVFRPAWTVTGVTPERLPAEGHDAHPRAIRQVFGNRVVPRANRDVKNHLEQDHRGITPRYRPRGGFRHGHTAARCCRAFDESAPFCACRRSALNRAP